MPRRRDRAASSLRSTAARWSAALVDQVPAQFLDRARLAVHERVHPTLREVQRAYRLDQGAVPTTPGAPSAGSARRRCSFCSSAASAISTRRAPGRRGISARAGTDGRQCRTNRRRNGASGLRILARIGPSGGPRTAARCPVRRWPAQGRPADVSVVDRSHQDLAGLRSTSRRVLLRSVGRLSSPTPCVRSTGAPARS